MAMSGTSPVAGGRTKWVARWGVSWSLLLAVGSWATATEMYVFVTKWGSSGSGNGQFSTPGCVAVDASGNVYVTDTGNHRVQKFRSDSIYLTQWGSQGAGNGQFSFPTGVAVDGSGNVYVADNGNRRLQKFRSDGTYLTQWGSFGSLNGQFAGPEGVAVDASGNAYVVSHADHRVEKFALAPPPRYTIAGKVTLTGSTAVSGITVTAGPGNHKATTAKDGSYKITGLVAGKYTVTPSKKGWKFTGKAVTVPPSRTAANFRGTKAPATAALLTRLTATPSRRGAQVTFGLSAPGSIDARILNLGGRPVRCLCAARDCDAGTNILLWDARSDAGLLVPNGRYLVEVVAKAPDGTSSRALQSLVVGHQPGLPGLAGADERPGHFPGRLLP